MKLLVVSFFTVLILLSPDILLSASNKKIRGEYLGQKKPGMDAELFAPGIVSTGLNEFNSTFSPDGREFYFSIRNGWSQMAVFVMKMTGNRWSEPELAPFSDGEFMNADPFFAPDGKTLYFCSNRPAPSRPNSTDWNIWAVKRNGENWGIPEFLDFNTEKNEMYVSVSKNGTVFFHADYENNTGKFDVNKTDIYFSRFTGGNYLPAEKLPGNINSTYAEWDPYVSPDESFLIFTSPRSDGYGSGDLYISFRQKDGSWEQPKNMGNKINSNSQDYCPNFSPDGKYFFFTSYKSKPLAKVSDYNQLSNYLNGPQNGSGGDIYWISSSIIDELAPNEQVSKVWWEDSGTEYNFNLKGKKILVLTGYDFDWHETILIPENLKKWGADIKYAGCGNTLEGHYKNKINNKLDMSERRSINIDLQLQEVSASDFDAVYIPGGYAPANLLKDPSTARLVTKLIREFNNDNKIIAAICHGPLLLAASGIINGKKVTGFKDIQPDLINAEGILVKEKYIIDKNILTGNWPFFETFSVQFAQILSREKKI